MLGSQFIETQKRHDDRASDSAFRGFLTWVAALGTCLVIVMATLAFGPSGFGFGAVIAILLFALMTNRYRFGLRTFFIFTTVLGVWLGLKVGRDLKLQRAITTISNAGGHLKIHDRRPNFPWGLWANRYNLDFYALSEPLTGEQLTQLEAFAPSSLSDLDLTNSGITDENLKFVASLANVEYLSLANDTYGTGERIPGRPQNHITDAGLETIRGLRQLLRIQLGGTDVTDECVKHLLEMPHLKCIYLEGTHVTGNGMAQLSALKDLGILELNGCSISADGYKELSRLTNLISLGLNNSGMTDADLDELNTLSQLGILRLRKNNVSNEAVTRFSEAHPKCIIDR
jgi:hypothetical protein